MNQTLKLNITVAALAMLATFGTVGCHPKPSLLADSFRLSVTHVIDDSDTQVMILHIEACGSPYYQVWSTNKNGSHSNRGAFTQSSAASELRQEDVRIYAFQVSPGADSKNDYVKTSTAAGWTLREVSKGTPLNKTFSVTVKDGIYPLNAPLVIGREDGADLKLAVGLQGTLEAMMGAAK
jgi:hypothetical protein